ncbi:Tfp pilus assembly protein FimT/FimU [Thermodesulfobacteriota bacterium]
MMSHARDTNELANNTGLLPAVPGSDEEPGLKTGPTAGGKSRGVHGRCKGFTLLELIVVIFVIAVATLLSAMMVGKWSAQTKFSGFIRSFRNAVILTRARAIARQKPVFMRITPVNESLWDNKEDYEVAEVKETDPSKLLYKDDSIGGDEKYWLEFRFVDRKTPKGISQYKVWVYHGDPKTKALDAHRQVRFDARGYAVQPRNLGNSITTYAVGIWGEVRSENEPGDTPSEDTMWVRVNPVGRIQ